MNLVQTDVTTLLQRLVGFPSLSGEETDLVNWLEEAVNSTGLLKTERYGDNLVFTLGEGDPWLLLNTHSDVVPPSPDHYGDPFDPVVKDGRIYGRGTTDAKGCLAAMLKALLNLADSGWKPAGRVSLAVTVCEEAVGKNNGMAHLRTLLPAPDAAIIGEPTSLAPCIAQKGLLILRLITRGTSGHAARIYGENAIYRMGSALQKLEKLTFDIKNTFLGEIKITPTTIEGGTARNANPEVCSAVIDIRTIPEYEPEAIIRAVSDATGADVGIISERYVSVQTYPTERIAQVCKAASGAEFIGSPTASDWVFLADVPVIKIGPGHSPQSHTSNEYIEIAQLEKGVAVYEQIIRRYSSNET
ncbi:MAG: M20/M25/M40 family metallo-hydrolase [Balneolaceae bacterium]|nr:MAG: M20/M25/M40 family metallo-hydrolase [Balneolaceae bacterium]